MPVAIDLGVILALVTWLIVLYGFLFVFRGIFKPLLVGIADLFDSISIPIPAHTLRPFGTVAGWARSAAAAIDHAIAQAILDSEKGIVLLWNAMAKQAEWLGGLLGDLAETVELRFRSLILGTIPKQLATIRRSLAHQFGAVRAAIATAESAAEAELARLRVGIDRTTARLEGKVGNLAGRIWTRVGRLERTAGRLDGEVRGLLHRLAPAAIVALIGATIFRTFKLGWLRCPGVGRIGRSLCGMGGLIEELFADVVAAFAVSDLCRFAAGIQSLATSIRPVLLEWVDVENALFRCPQADYPPALPHFLSSPTPVHDPVTL